MPFQIPREDHPWRSWKGDPEKARTARETAVAEEAAVESKGLKPVKVFLEEIVSSWSEVEVITSAYGREGRYRLSELPQSKIAAWISGILRRNYAA